MISIEAMKAQAELEKRNLEVIQRLFQGLNNGSTQILEDAYAPDVAFHFPSIGNPLSKVETIQFLAALYQAYPDTHWEVHEMIPKGDKVVVWSTVTGTNRGDFLGIPATQKKIRVGEIVIYRLENERIVEERVERDALGQVTQLGMQVVPQEEAQATH